MTLLPSIEHLHKNTLILKLTSQELQHAHTEFSASFIYLQLTLTHSSFIFLPLIENDFNLFNLSLYCTYIAQVLANPQLFEQ